MVDAYKCSECGVGAVTRRREDSDLPHWQCRDCSAPPESNEIERVQEVCISRAIEMFTAHCSCAFSTPVLQLVSETERMFGAAQGMTAASSSSVRFLCLLHLSWW